jgi:hypothetical protein
MRAPLSEEDVRSMLDDRPERTPTQPRAGAWITIRGQDEGRGVTCIVCGMGVAGTTPSTRPRATRTHYRHEAGTVTVGTQP